MESVDEEADRRRETAIASSSSLRPNFYPKTISETQLSKFQELHKRRLQIKAKTKVHKKTKGKGKSCKKAVEDKQCDESKQPGDQSSINGVGENSSTAQHNVDKNVAAKQRTKLHWGLDTRERWERKSNM